MARARFDQGEDQEFHAAFFQFTVEHTAARYTSLKNMSNQGRVHEVCAKNHMPDKHGIGHPPAIAELSNRWARPSRPLLLGSQLNRKLPSVVAQVLVNKQTGNLKY
jgi:hypothetical protein